MACASLSVLALMSQGCLITDPPQFKPPEHTKPWLDVATADPNPRFVYKIDGEPGTTAPATLSFRANVHSQDDLEGFFAQVNTKLYIDLGFNNPFNPTRPYRYVISGKPLEPGSLDQDDRVARATWDLTTQDVAPGCHLATLVVSHKFDSDPAPECPVCSDDWSAITWQILRCDKSNGDCGALPIEGELSCGMFNNSCASAQDLLRTTDGGVTDCPSTLDGGTVDGGSL